MEDLGIRGRTFTDLLKATEADPTQTEEVSDNDMPEVLNDSIPILSPALGYSLALIHFAPIYTNYFERPELHKLHNRSSELWSPLMALAAFFEEQGGIRDLRSAISDAATWDDQMSEGKSLSDREEAVLQALELLTLDELKWIKAGDLRE